MVTRDTAWPAGTPCWVDLSVDDLAKARAFYSAVFGWSVPEGPPEAGGYSMCEIDGQPVAGIGPKMGPAEMPSVWTTYLATPDADETASKVKAAGGQLMMEPMDVMDAGRMGVAVDPGGAMFGLWQAGLHTGVRLANEPGSLVWNENMSRDFDGNKAFYQAVFGYEYGDMSSGDFKYATLDLDGRPVGGIGEMGAGVPAGHPAHWSTYFGVQDTDATVAKVTELGGRVVQPAWDSPYGRMAVLADDQGAVFAVMSVSPASEV
jgi:predicted enzyme related to lactoylglutathione lyase